MIAALFVETNGPYFGLKNIDPWDKTRDARKYNGPYPVIAHPPCERWGRYWSGGPSAKVRRKLGDDDGCFEAALRAVRTYGGVLEHPAHSHAWKYFGLQRPPRNGGWILADNVGYTCHVEQGHYGHKARKATWLYFFDPQEIIPKVRLKWGKSTGMRLDEGFHSKEERKLARESGQKPIKRLSTKDNKLTPIEFRNILISLCSKIGEKG